MQIMKIALTKFLGKLFNKHRGGVKMKINIFLEAFEVISLSRGCVSSVGVDHPIWVWLLISVTRILNFYRIRIQIYSYWKISPNTNIEYIRS